MAYMQSPGIEIKEKDASAITVGLSSTVGATVGQYRWGPVSKPQLISNDGELVSLFGSPDDATATYFFAAANFLKYTTACWVNRVIGAGALNASTSGAGVLIQNKETFDGSASWTGGTFAARYPGAMGSGLIVSIADSATFATWAYKAQFSQAPATSDFATSVGGSNDELHVIVIDGTGKFSGTAGTVLEKYEFVSKASDAVSYQGTSNYYMKVINEQSSYVYSLAHDADGTNWGTTAVSTAFVSLSDAVGGAYDFTYTLSGGADGTAVADAQLQTGWDEFADAQTYDISLCVTGNASKALAKYVVQNVGDIRKDCLVFTSITATASGVASPILSTSASKITDAIAFKDFDSTYAVIDSGYKYMYDKYNDKYRWIALNADIAGLCAKIDNEQDPWISPAGMTKGQIKDVVKLSWNPNKSERDELYPIGINPVISKVGTGTVLFGDKTATAKPSAFGNIGIRRMFLVLEKSIENSAKYQLFELNDEITRLQFIASVEPFLRNVKGRRGLEEFKVICDETNNTPQVIASHSFVGTILVKPKYSINFITLNFVAVGPNVSFEIAAAV